MRRSLIAALVVPALGWGCSEPPAEPEMSSETSVVANDLADVAIVHDDRLVFPRNLVSQALRDKISTYAAADGDEEGVEKVLLVGGRGRDAIREDGSIDEAAPNAYGFMRRALSFRDEGDDMVIETAPASIEEVFAELDENGQIDIGAAPPGAGPPGKEAQGSKQIDVPTIPLIDLSGLEIYRKGDDYVRLTSAYVHLDLDLDVGVDVSRLRLQETHVIVRGDVTSELAVEASMLNTPPAVGVPITREVFVAKYPLPPLGPVPMTLALRINVGCRLSGGGFDVTGGAGAEIHFEGGVRYTRGEGVSPAGSASIDPYVLDPSASLLASKQITTRCAAEPRIEVLFYDTVGPVVKASAFADFRFDTQPAHLTIRTGVEADLGGTLRVFGYHVGDLSGEIFSRQAEVWSSAL